MRTIDADALYKDICRAYDECGDILEIIDKQPTIELRKGKWIKRKGGALGYNCSCCGKSDISNHFNYCPNCGAQMTE